MVLKKRFNRRKRSRTNGGSKSLTTRVSKMERKLQRTGAPEMKEYSQTLTGTNYTAFTASTTIDLCNPTEGLTDESRLGNQILVHRYEINIFAQENGNAAFVARMLRTMVVVDRRPQLNSPLISTATAGQSVTDSTVAQMFSAGHDDQASAGRFRVLHDRMDIIDNTVQSVAGASYSGFPVRKIFLRGSFKTPLRMEFNGGGGGGYTVDHVKNSMILMLCNNNVVAANYPSVYSGYARVWFTDA